jgi:putative MATE family efflux protein
MKKSYEMDMCNGPILGKLIIFAVPLMLSGFLQLFFNAMDIVVVGKFSGSQALAAVGSTGALINLFVNVFIGFSIGANVLVAQFFGAKDEKNMQETVHTSILLALIGGVILIVGGFLFAGPMLELMGTPDDVLDSAVLYIHIYFIGMPAMLVYNFGASILRAIGDTRRPLYYLFTAGIVNVVLNLFFVIVLHMDVAGVATATVISQTISASLIVRCLVRSDGMYRLDLRKLHIYKSKLIRIVQIGLPAGMQGAVFSISNVLIQSSINSFGSIAMAGNTAAGNIESFVYTSMNAMYQSALSFVSQNVGGGRQERIPKIAVRCLGVVFLVGLILGNGAYFIGRQLLGLYSSDPEVISYGLGRMQMICKLYFLCGMMDVTVGLLRGMGYSIMPMIMSLVGACGLRVVWIFTVFQWNHTLHTLYLSYPITWGITFLAQLTCFLIVWKRKKGVWAMVKRADA